MRPRFSGIEIDLLRLLVLGGLARLIAHHDLVAPVFFGGVKSQAGYHKNCGQVMSTVIKDKDDMLVAQTEIRHLKNTI